MEGSAGSSSGTKIGVDGGKIEAADVAGRDLFEDWKAFFEFLRNRQPPRSLCDCTDTDAVEFLRGLPSDKVEAVVRSLNVDDTFKRILGSEKANPFDSQIVRTFLMEFAEEQQTSENEYDKRKLSSHHNKEDLLEMRLTTKDMDNVDSLIIPYKDARKYFFFGIKFQGVTNGFMRFTDEEGKRWRFEYSYHDIGRRCEFTTGWSRYVKEKQLSAGDSVFFQRDRTRMGRLFIGCIRRVGGAAPRNDALDESSRSTVLNPTSSGKSEKKLVLREKLKEVETSFQQRLPEHSITGFDPILVISCGNNQDSDETYFISCIFNELYIRGFTPCKYDLTRSTVTGNPDMLFRSRVCILIITMNYARSRECLNEFVAIMGQFNPNNNLALLPVFFNEISGSFEDSVQASELQKWRKALNKLSVYKKHQYTKGDEVMLARCIVRDVRLLINSETCGNLIGIKLRLESILPLLQCPQPSGPQIVGIWGMAGIGKTVIAREIFRTQAQRYDLSYFLPDFHLMCQTKGLSHLRDDFFSKILGEEKVFIDECDTKISFIRDRFLNKRVLIVLDGVSNARDAEVLVGGFGWFSGGHTIILTSRNRQVLVQCKAKALFEIPKLSWYESFRLCGQFATEQNWKGRMPLISVLVNYAGGIPLALRVLGSSVQKQCINNAKQHLRRLRQHPPVEIQDAFKRSFDGLDDDEKNIFLDLACFFRGENKDHVVNILDGCGFFTDLGIYGLIDESLISLVDNKIEMPNIFQDTGRFVVCQEYEEVGKRSRLWDSNDIVGVLTNNSGTNAIEGIFLDMSGLSFELSPTVFERMHRLRLLKLHCPTSENHWKVCLPQGLHSLPDELRLLHWERYPLGSLPRTFNPKNLVELNMPYSNINRLWKGTKILEKLKRLILSHSRQLTKFPRLSKARNLEHIDLEGCVNLVKVNSSIIHHHKLTFLSLKDCSHLRIMPPTVHLESLEILNLSGCSELENLQDLSPNLKELYLAGTVIREMPSIGDLTRLVTLDLENCERLQHLPPGISNLKAMVTLKLSGCSNLKSLPNLDALFLSDLHSHNTKRTKEVLVAFKHHSAIQVSRDAESWLRVTITPLPSSILHSLASRLYCLVSLFLCHAYLVDIPEELCWLASLKTLDLGGSSFSQIPKSIKELRKLHIHGRVNLFTAATDDSTLRANRPSSSKDREDLSTMEHMTPPYKKFALKRVFETFILNLRKRKREMSVSTVKNRSKVQSGSVSPWSGNVFPERPGHPECLNYMMTGDCKFGNLCIFHHPRDRETSVPESSLSPIGLPLRPEKGPCRSYVRKGHCISGPSCPFDHPMWSLTQTTASSMPYKVPHMDMLGPFMNQPSNKLLETSTESRQAISGKDVIDTEQEEEHPLEHMAPPYKRCRLKGVIETVILSLTKRKREKSVSTVKNLSKVHLGPVSARLEHDQNDRYLKHNEGKELGSHKFLTTESSPSQSISSLTESPTYIRKPAQSAARIHQVSRAHALEKKLLKEFGDSKFGLSVSGKPERFYSDESLHDAAIRIQTKFRGYKCRKQRLFTRQGTILIQARWRGYQARKNYQNLIMSMGILE